MNYRLLNSIEEKEYLDKVLVSYAKELILRNSCENMEKALIQSKKEIDEILTFSNKKLMFFDKNDIGFAWISDCEFEKEKAIFLVDILVKEEYRGKGFSKEILEELIKYGKENKYKYIMLSVTKNNLVACHLYEKFGFKELDGNDFAKDMIKEL